jgi:hypothetical protein
VPGAGGRIAVPDDDPVVGAVGMVAQRDLGGHQDRVGLRRPPSAVDRVREHDPGQVVDHQEGGVEVRDELFAVLAEPGHERAAGPDLQAVDPADGRGRHPPFREAGRVGPGVPHSGPGSADDPLQAQVQVGVHG